MTIDLFYDNLQNNMSDLDFSLPALIIRQREQKKQKIYLTTIKASELSVRPDERFIVDYYERHPGLKDTGYQRTLNKNAVERIKNFVLQETNNPLLPTAILANSRYALDFKESKECKNFGILHVNTPLYIIDGQHRFEAWKSMMDSPTLKEEWGNYEFPLIILSNFKEYQEIEQFYVINSRQKKIKTDLAQRHLLELAKREETSNLISKKDRWQLFATKIVDILNEQIEGVWNNKIILPSDKPDERKIKIITQSSFVSSLKPFFVGKGFIMFDTSTETPNGSKLESWAKFIAIYWGNIEIIYPNAIKNFRDYSLMKTVGTFSLHLLLQKEFSRSDNNNINEAIKMAVKDIDKASQMDFNELFWKSNVPSSIKDQGKYAGAYSNSAGHNRLAASILTGGNLI
ncbi:MAG: hypothetical protein A2Z35_01490 [Actinobacteria bacterium RBG_19FT_COMBO_36_27]|nr:MAG: hypothetical protein A2Z35_01490 [Actinobacteria bacterium RBG_19FT_COMBO_36_27]